MNPERCEPFFHLLIVSQDFWQALKSLVDINLWYLKMRTAMFKTRTPGPTRPWEWMALIPFGTSAI
jgi:hypothetical protein